VKAGPTRVGVIGTGRIGRLHAGNLYGQIPGAVLVTVADANIDAARACASLFDRVDVAEHPDTLLARDDIDAVLICTSTDTHARFIEAAAKHGKHIFCEKPIALTLAEIDHALAAVDRAGVIFQVGFNRRFDANYARVRAALVGDEIGHAEMIHIVSRDPSPPPLDYIRTSGGILIDMAIHDFDMARFLIGDEVEEVYATGGVLIDPAIGEAGDIDSAVTVLRFRNGVIGTIENSRRASYGYDQRVEVLGSLGAVSTGNVFADTATISDAKGIHRDPPLHFFLERYQASFVAEMTRFVEAVSTGAPAPVTGADGRAAVVLALAANCSLQERRPVRLAEIRADGRGDAA
jgi:myo-inositol 2-dehydrogenase/D-chiro-inositol 1-dehydrogenase